MASSRYRELKPITCSSPEYSTSMISSASPNSWLEAVTFSDAGLRASFTGLFRSSAMTETRLNAAESVPLTATSLPGCDFGITAS